MLTDGKSWFYVEGIFSLRARFGDLRGTEVLVRDNNFYFIRPGAVTNEADRAVMSFLRMLTPTRTSWPPPTPLRVILSRKSFDSLSVYSWDWGLLGIFLSYQWISLLSPCALESGPNTYLRTTSETMRAQGTHDLICICSVYWWGTGQAVLVSNSHRSITSLSSCLILNPVFRCRCPRTHNKVCGPCVATPLELYLSAIWQGL